MDTATVTELSRDPSLIKGIYEACDLLCMYCRVPQQCLLFRLRPAGLAGSHARSANEDDDRMLQSLQMLKHLAELEEREPPIEIDAFLSSDPQKRKLLFTLDDSLEKLGGSYMNLATAYLQTRSEFPVHVVRRDTGPTPLEELAWFHDLMPARIFRAILSAKAQAAGFSDRSHDATVAAKLALVGIDRSLAAATVIAADDNDPRLPLMLMQLQLLKERVESRFPAARAYRRPGLDQPE